MQNSDSNINTALKKSYIELRIKLIPQIFFMTKGASNNKIKKLRMITEAKLEYLKQHTKMVDQAFEELASVTESELDVVHERIQEIDNRLRDKGI